MPKTMPPTDEIDKNILPLVKALNEFEGVHTVGSCGGHENPSHGQWPAGTFYVKFDLDHTEHGWRALEFLAWFVNEVMANTEKGTATLMPVSPPPYLNTPGDCLSFVIEGYRELDPIKMAILLNRMRKQCYYAVGQAD
jgi:hypothetical protein